MDRLGDARALLGALSMTPNEANKVGLSLNLDGVRRSALDLLSFPDITFETLGRIWPDLLSVDPATMEQISNDAHYRVYLDRQQADIDAFRRDEALAIPGDFDYSSLSGLSNEVREKLELHRPVTLGQAGRINGITPAALTLLLSAVRRSPSNSGKSAA